MGASRAEIFRVTTIQQSSDYIHRRDFSPPWGGLATKYKKKDVRIAAAGAGRRAQDQRPGKSRDIHTSYTPTHGSHTSCGAYCSQPMTGLWTCVALASSRKVILFLTSLPALR